MYLYIYMVYSIATALSLDFPYIYLQRKSLARFKGSSVFRPDLSSLFRAKVYVMQNKYMRAELREAFLYIYIHYDPLSRVYIYTCTLSLSTDYCAKYVLEFQIQLTV